MTKPFAVLHYATQLVDNYNRLMKYYERSMDAQVREGRLAQSNGAPSQNQSQLLSRHGDFSGMAEHWVATNHSSDRTVRGFEPGRHHHQQRHGPMDDQK